MVPHLLHLRGPRRGRLGGQSGCWAGGTHHFGLLSHGGAHLCLGLGRAHGPQGGAHLWEGRKPAGREESDATHIPQTNRALKEEGKGGGGGWFGALRQVGSETTRTWEGGLTQGQVVANESLGGPELGRTISELFVTHEGLSCPASEQISLIPESLLTWNLERGLRKEPVMDPVVPRMIPRPPH